MVEFVHSHPRFGTGVQIQRGPQELLRTFRSFRAGYFSADAVEEVPEESSPDALDVYVTDKDRVKRVPGTSLIDTISGRTPTRIEAHASLDFTSEILLIAPPDLGVKRLEGEAITWIAAGLGDSWFAGTNFGGTYILTDGNKVYFREPEDTALTEADEIPVAKTYAVFGSRLVAGNTLIEGNLEPQGIRWSAANSDFRDFSSLGAGSELLIDANLGGDEIIALRTMGFDHMLILMRNSIWVGRFTGLVSRPIDARPRIVGTGAISEETCVATRMGVFFLSTDGVYVYDGNELQMVSQAINPDLLPLDLSDPDKYSAIYNPLEDLYYLFTDTDTWVFDLQWGRWHRRSMVADSAVIHPQQTTSLTWGELTGDWGSQTGSWQDYGGKGTGELDLIFLGDRGADKALDKEDPDSLEAFGTALDPYWEFLITDAELIDYLTSIQRIVLRSQGEGSVGLYLPDSQNDYELVQTQKLTGTAKPSTFPFPVIHTGLGVGLRIDIQSGDPEIIAAQLQGVLRARRIEATTVDLWKIVEEENGLLAMMEYDNLDNPFVESDWGTESPDGTRVDPTVTAEGYLRILSVTASGASRYLPIADRSKLFLQIVGETPAIPAFLRPAAHVQEYTLDGDLFDDTQVRLHVEIDISNNTVVVEERVSGVEHQTASIGMIPDKAVDTPYRANIFADGNDVEVYDFDSDSLLSIVTDILDLGGMGIETDDDTLYSHLYIMKDKVITVNGLPTGAKVELRDEDDLLLYSEFETDGTVLFNEDGKHQWPGISKVVVFDAAGIQIADLEPSLGIWGGSIFQVS